MMWLGDYNESSTNLSFMFNTHKPDGTPITLAGSPALAVYKGNSTTESIAGITLATDFDSLTGLHHVTIDLSSDAFYAAGSDYAVVVTAGTVDGVSIAGTCVAQFSLRSLVRH